MEIEHIKRVEDIRNLLAQGEKLELGEKAKAAILKAHAYIKKQTEETSNIIYGVNTGFGSLCDTVINRENLETLQYNLIRSHACGTGDYVPLPVVKLMLLLKIKSLSFGYSGVSLDTVHRLIDFYNLDILPVIYTQGSLGASGDLAPLSHLSLPLIGEGEVWHRGAIAPASEVCDQFKLKPIQLGAKEGLALINGTQFMLAYAVYCQLESEKILQLSSRIAAISLEAFDARIEPFLPYTHEVRNQTGQQEIAAEIYRLLEGSENMNKPKKRVQDPYSFRCIPQVHGASADALKHCFAIFEKELNAVTDNPNVFADLDLVISGGNFHGQPLALSLDFAALALSELASISERRVYKLISGTYGLPAFLANQPGLESGFMIAQYTAAGIVSQNKQLCSPASIDSIESSNGQEDHVSMGANAATKLLKIVENVQQVLAIEMLVAAKAMHLKKPIQISTPLQEFLSAYQNAIPPVDGDTYLSPLLRKSKSFLFAES